MRRLGFFKGHANRHDFVLVDDQHGMHEFDADTVRRLCDRQAGVGADGLVRIVRARHIPQWSGDMDQWFLEYHNANGESADICGHGVRVAARYLMNEQLVSAERFEVATRAGIRRVEQGWDGNITVSAEPVGVRPDAGQVTIIGKQLPATLVDFDEPYAVVCVTPDELDGLLLHSAALEPPEGAALTLVTEPEPAKLQVRVVGDAQGYAPSCGRGALAAATAWRVHHPSQERVIVELPGGQVCIDFQPHGAMITGPAVITVRGEYWW